VTDASGDIDTQTLIYNHYYYDPYAQWNNTAFKITGVIKNDYDVSISASGYTSERFKLKMNKKQELTIALQPILSNNQHRSVVLP
jgi:hypothetical protein